MSTYSPNLRIELITTGTQAGTWGTTTNTNLGTLIESSIAGLATVTVTSTAQAFTANNGAADESRNANIQLVTSGVSTAFAVYAPPATKQYVIYNNSSYTATIYNSTVLGNTTAAGTGIAIPAGATMTVWSDGTSFYQQNNYFNTPTINTPSLTGTPTAPTATYGTSTTQVATTAFVQAALQALYPVGSIYTSTVSTSPATLFGFGTWVAYGAGRVMIGAGGGYTAGATGGSADSIVVAHTHTGSTGTESASHFHGFSGTTGTTSLTGSLNAAFLTGNGVFADNGARNYPRAAQDNNRPDVYGMNFDASHSHSFSGNTGTESATHNHTFTTDSTGSSGVGANLQPYVVVYMWNRTV